MVSRPGVGLNLNPIAPILSPADSAIACCIFSNRKFAKSMQSLFLTTSLLIIFFCPHSVRAQVYGSAAHTVRVSVSVISVLRVSAGGVSLSITGAAAIAGQDQMTVVDQSTSLLWGVNTTPKKITAVSNLASPKYTLKLLALNPTQGTPAAELVVDNTAADLLLNIGLTRGSCTLRYTGIALASQGTGSDTHTVTFTIAVQ